MKHENTNITFDNIKKIVQQQDFRWINCYIITCIILLEYAQCLFYPYMNQHKDKDTWNVETDFTLHGDSEELTKT